MYVSVIIPVYNERRYIDRVLEGLFAQDWTQPFEIIIVDGNSTDGTVDKVNEMRVHAPRWIDIRVLGNPHRHIPRSLNIAAAAARGTILIRLDGHTVPPSDLIRRSVEGLKSIQFKGIAGGRIEIRPSTSRLLAEGISEAVAHPLGTGNATYRSTTPSNAKENSLLSVDTVPFGAFTKELWSELGGFDEQMLSAEDYDFAFRARKRGYFVVLDPQLVIRYFARPNLRALAQQYFRYGYWTTRLIIKHREVPAIRKLVPFGLVLSTGALTAIEPIVGGIWVILYVGSLLGMLLWDSPRKRKGLRKSLVMLIALILAHWSYGLGNLAGLLPRRKVHYEHGIGLRKQNWTEPPEMKFPNSPE